VLAAGNLLAPQALQIRLGNGTPVGAALRLQGAV
jgi:hypothetical protein